MSTVVPGRVPDAGGSPRSDWDWDVIVGLEPAGQGFFRIIKNQGGGTPPPKPPPPLPPPAQKKPCCGLCGLTRLAQRGMYLSPEDQGCSFVTLAFLLFLCCAKERP